MQTVVYKIGGSLLTLADLTGRLQALLAQTDARKLIVVGGGAATDVVRGWEATHGLDSETSHWLALGAMGLNEELLARLLDVPRVSSRDEADRAWSTAGCCILDAEQFLRREETAHAARLPHDWTATSDSIAAWASLVWPAEQLVLVKSTEVPRCGAAEAARLQLVDSYFARLADRLGRVCWCNLRDPEPFVRSWLNGGHPDPAVHRAQRGRL